MNKPRNFSFTTPNEDPFNGKFNGELLYDYHFEKESYWVEKKSIEKYGHGLNILTKTRDTLWFTFQIVSGDLRTLGADFDENLLHTYETLFLRMIKESKIIQDLTIKGNYIEADSIFRNFLEGATIIQYFTKFPDMLVEYTEGKRRQDNKILSKFNMKKMSEEIGKPYELYKKLCQSSHINIYPDDVKMINLNEKLMGIMTQYNSYQEKFLVQNIHGINNILIETFDIMMDYVKKNGENKIIPEIQKVLDRRKEVTWINVEYK